MGDRKRIALGMSGGVDSSVAAAVLLRAGFEVVGVTCLFHDAAVDDASVIDARAVCDLLDVEHVVRDCSSAFERDVVKPFVADYAAGLTPSPCVGCNADVKVPSLLDVADDLSCSHVATGHYARVAREGGEGRFAISCGIDDAKDQSYMLARLSQGQLSRLVLPLGDMTKRAVREMARDLGFESVADRPDSQDICFAPRGHRDLLSLKGVRFEPGPILLDGVKVGEHTGLADYTIGQRKGIGVAGPEPYYVIAKIPEGNVLVIAPERESRVERVIVRDVRWQAVRALDGIMNAMVKLRYRSKACPCIIEEFENDRVLVRLSSPQPATAPGQHAVFYRESTVLGGGVIEEVG